MGDGLWDSQHWGWVTLMMVDPDTGVGVDELKAERGLSKRPL